MYGTPALMNLCIFHHSSMHFLIAHSYCVSILNYMLKANEWLSNNEQTTASGQRKSRIQHQNRNSP